MYDIPRLRTVLPYCTKLDFESHDDQLNGTQKVIVICHYMGGLEARIECPGMPPDTDSLAELVAAGAVQCLANFAKQAHFQFGKHSRKVMRDGGDGKPFASGPRLMAHPPQAPSVREVVQTMANVIDVDGEAGSSTQVHQATHRPRPKKPARTLGPHPDTLATPALEPPLGQLDAGKAKRASAAMAALLQATQETDEEDEEDTDDGFSL